MLSLKYLTEILLRFKKMRNLFLFSLLLTHSYDYFRWHTALRGHNQLSLYFEIAKEPLTRIKRGLIILIRKHQIYNICISNYKGIVG